MSTDLTLILGPQTKGALALNAFVREAGAALAAEGVHALPSRVASPLVRRLLDARIPAVDRQRALDKAAHARPAILAALNTLGSPEAALKNGAFFPDAEATLEGLAPFLGAARIVLIVERLPALFLASNSDRIEARARATSWEVLFEFGWARLARAITEAMPKAELLVLTPKGMGQSSAAVLKELFGTVGGDPNWLLRALINETGRAVLDRMGKEEPAPAQTLSDLYTSFADQPSLDEMLKRLGIEKITSVLLDQRFEEDLAEIAALPRAEVV